MTMDTTLDTEKLKNVAAEVARKFGLLLVVLFGSYATGHTHRQSDIDVAMLSEQPLDIREQIRIGFELERALRAGPVEVVDLKHAPPLLLKADATDGVVLYERDQGVFAEFQLRAMKRYVETRRLRELQKDALQAYLQTV